MNVPARDLSKYEPSIAKYDSIDLFLGAVELNDGLHVISHSASLQTEVLFENRNSKTTMVFFNGAGIASSMTRPGFTGVSMMKSISEPADVNRIYIHDATLYHEPSNSLTWYAGCSELSLQRELPKIIEKFVSAAESQRLVFFGVSGGAFAALYYSSKFSGSAVIATNPQTVLPRYHGWEFAKYSRTCWGSSDALSLEMTKGLFDADLTEIYANPVDNYVYYLNNSTDEHHLTEHLRPFASKLHPSNRVQVLLRNWGDGHVAPVPDIFLELIRCIIRSSEWKDLSSLLGSKALTSEVAVDESLREATQSVTYEFFDGTTKLSDQPIEVAFPEPISGTLLINADYTADESIPSNAFMVTLEFHKSDSGLEGAIAGINSLRTSNDPSIGHFCLLPVKPGSGSTVHKVYIPSDYPVLSLGIRNWGKSSSQAELIVHGLNVQSFD